MKINKPPLNEENFSNEKLCFLEEQSIHRVPFFQTHDTMMEGEKEEKGGKKIIPLKLHASLVSNFIYMSLVTETPKMEKATKSKVKNYYGGKFLS